jgi:hypothetical protein
MIVTLLQKRRTCVSSGLSLISVNIGQAFESDRGIPIDTGCSPQFPSRFCETPRCVPASEPVVQIVAG